MPSLPPDIARACAPLFAALPLDQSMPRLLGSHPLHGRVVEEVLRQPEMEGRDDLAAGLWLYVDDLERSHRISQGQDDATGAYWHGIMHRREGDYSNSHYWMRRAAAHPLLREQPELDPAGFVEAVSAARGQDRPELVERQRQEWLALFEWCAANG
jgi:hypothetical protein